MYGINAKEMVMFMAQSVDIFQKSKLLTLAFELNIDKWDTMSETVKAAVSSGWQSIKYLNEEGTGVNSEIAQIPNDCGGIYIFLLKPDKIPQLHRYIMYIGRARRASNFSLRQRCARYINDTIRPIEDAAAYYYEKQMLRLESEMRWQAALIKLAEFDRKHGESAG